MSNIDMIEAVHDGISPFFRFAVRYRMSVNEVHGPRITYIQSVNLIEEGGRKAPLQG